MGKQIPEKETSVKLRLLSLAGAAIAVSLLLLACYGRKPDTATLSILGNAIVSPAGTDSTLYMQMGESAFRSGQRIYPQLFFTDHQKFIYPPTSLFLIEGLNLLGTHGLSFELVWKIILLLAWAGCTILGVLFYRQRRPQATVPGQRRFSRGSMAATTATRRLIS